METSTCKRCESTVEYYPSDKRGIYCSACIESADELLPDNPSEKGRRVTVNCRACSSEFEIRPARLESQERGFFCTLECYGEWLSANVVGSDHHQWEGGSIDYGQRWWRVRRRALERDDYECQHCGADDDDFDRNPDVHHLQPVRSFDRSAEAHTMDNVITLCRSCHRHAEEGTITVVPRDEK